MVVPDKGLAAISAKSPGVIVAVAAKEGDTVTAGALLVQVRTEQDSRNATSSAAQVEQAIQTQDANLLLQIGAAKAAASAQQSQLLARQAGIRSELVEIQSQIAIQGDLIATAREDLGRVERVAERGFISRRDVQLREEKLLSLQQGLSELNQNFSSKKAALSEAERSTAEIAAQARTQSASLSAARAQVGQLAASTAGSRSYVVRAPISGTVTAISARIGQPTDPQQPMMTIVPSGSELEVELALPSSAIGFVKKGQRVRIAIDAFPYQRFGTVSGTVFSIAKSAISRQGQDNFAVSIYPVRVKLDQSSIEAYGRFEPLVAGMNVSARIVTERQTLLEWLFEPVFAVGRR